MRPKSALSDCGCALGQFGPELMLVCDGLLLFGVVMFADKIEGMKQ